MDKQPTEEQIQIRMALYRKKEKRHRYLAALQNMALQLHQILPVHQLDDEVGEEGDDGNLQPYRPTGLWKKMLEDVKEEDEDEEEDEDFDEDDEEEDGFPSSEDSSFDELDMNE